jgi:hypothetical protein
MLSESQVSQTGAQCCSYSRFFQDALSCINYRVSLDNNLFVFHSHFLVLFLLLFLLVSLLLFLFLVVIAITGAGAGAFSGAFSGKAAVTSYIIIIYFAALETLILSLLTKESLDCFLA